MTVEILIVLALFLVNGVFSMSEMAVISARKSRLRQLSAAGKAGAACALRLAEAPDRFLPTVQTGITLVGLLAGAFSGITLAEEIAEVLKPLPALARYADAVGVGAVVLALTFLSLIIGELVPKRIALAAPEEIACRLARPIELLSIFARPVVQVLSAATSLVLRVFRVRAARPESVSEDEVRLLLQEGSESGVFHKDEPRMVESVLAFDRLPIREIMTPGVRLVHLRLDDTPETLWRKITTTGHSSFPVVGEDRDRILGVVSVKSIYANLAAGARAQIADLMTPPLFVAPEDAVTKVLNAFKRTGVHIAMVREQDGRAAGLVTLVDMLEAIVGDLPSLEDRLRPEARQRADHSWLVDGQYELRKLATLLGATIALPSPEVCATVATLAQHRLKDAPREGDIFTCSGLEFEIIDMDRTSVDKVLIRCEPDFAADGSETRVTTES